MRDQQKVKFGRYPYTVTRVKVMKSSLLRKDDYIRMENMGYNEIARILEEGEYKDVMSEFSGTHSGVELIELALNESLAHTVQKLLRISNKKEVVQLIETYALKWVLNNFKLILKVKMGIVSPEEMKKIQIPISPTDYNFSLEMVKEDVSSVIKEVASMIDVDKKTLTNLYEKKSIIEMENEMDKGYYRKLLSLSKRMKMKKQDPLKQFIEDIVTLTNIRTIIRMKSKGADKGKIINSIVVGKKLKRSDIEYSMLAAGDMKASLLSLGRTKFRLLANEQVLEDISLLESLSEKFLYKYAFSLLHRQPLSVSPIFGFLLLKEIEVRNLRLFVHAKSLNLEKDFIESNMVVN